MVDFSPDVLAWKQLSLPKFGGWTKDYLCAFSEFFNSLYTCHHQLSAYFSRKYLLDLVYLNENYDHIWQAWPQLSWSDICQIWMSLEETYDSMIQKISRTQTSINGELVRPTVKPTETVTSRQYHTPENSVSNKTSQLVNIGVLLVVLYGYPLYFIRGIIATTS